MNVIFGSANSIFVLDNLFCRYITPLLLDKYKQLKLKALKKVASEAVDQKNLIMNVFYN
jgi:hypothetical protein